MVNRILRNNRPFSPVITGFELQAEKIKQSHIVALLTFLSLSIFLIIKLSELREKTETTTGFAFALFFITLTGTLLFSSLWKNFRLLFGPLGRCAFVSNKVQDEQEVGREEYIWIRAACADYPDLRILVKSMEDAKGNQTVGNMRFFWQIVGRRDILQLEEANQEIIRHIPFLRTMPLSRPFHLWCGITCYVLSPVKSCVSNWQLYSKIILCGGFIFGLVTFILRTNLISKIMVSRDLQILVIGSMIIAYLLHLLVARYNRAGWMNEKLNKTIRLHSRKK